MANIKELIHNIEEYVKTEEYSKKLLEVVSEKEKEFVKEAKLMELNIYI